MDMQDDQAGQQPEEAADLTGDQDPLLVLFMRQTRLGIEPGMTLMVGGLLVSGVLVGFRQYLEGIANEFRNATSDTPGVGAALAGAFDTAMAELDAEEPGDGDGDGSSDQDGPLSFIHLKDVRVRDQQGNSIRAPWWRGRLGAVDGFIFGTPT